MSLIRASVFFLASLAMVGSAWRYMVTDSPLGSPLPGDYAQTISGANTGQKAHHVDGVCEAQNLDGLEITDMDCAAVSTNVHKKCVNCKDDFDHYTSAFAGGHNGLGEANCSGRKQVGDCTLVIGIGNVCMSLQNVTLNGIPKFCTGSKNIPITQVAGGE